jgi:Na+-translocating ferredoxin:NAD+ oxidoreductase RnfC subunit
MSGETFERKVTTPAEREARKTFRQLKAEMATKDHEKAQKAFHDNRERLKAERLAREAARRRRRKDTTPTPRYHL